VGAAPPSFSDRHSNIAHEWHSARISAARPLSIGIDARAFGQKPPRNLIPLDICPPERDSIPTPGYL
jgi:hypothetical protein